MADLRADMFSGDSAKQTGALMSTFALLSAGRDTAPLVSAALALLGNPSTAVEPKRLAYDLAMAAPLSDADLSRLAVAVQSDLQRGCPAEVRAKALLALPALPGHRLEALLTGGNVLERLVLSLRSANDAVRAAAIDAIADLTARERTLQLAAEAPGTLGALIDLWEGITDALLDETDVVCANACAALAQLLAADDSAAAPLPDAGALVLSNLTDSAHKRLGGLLGQALARFRALGTVLLVAVPPLLVAYLKGLSPLPEERRLDALPGDVGSVGRCHAHEEGSVLLVELLHSLNPAVLLAAATALLELAKMEGASAAVLSVLPQAASAIISAASNTEGQLSAAQPQVLVLLLENLPVMPAVQQPLLFQRLLPLVAGIPSAAQRTRGLARLWSAVLRYDWAAAAGADKAAAAGARSGAGRVPPAAPTSQLQQLLLEPAIKEAVSGMAGSGDVGAALAAAAHPPVFPAFREELVGSLLYVLLSNPRGVASGVAASTPVAGASSLVAEASEMQALVEGAEWLGSAKVALQGTKACLGWDRVAASLTTGTTAITDLWLQLLLATIQVAQAVKARLAARQAEVPNGAVAAAAADGRQTVAALGQSVLRRVGAIDMDMQGMLLQIAANWRALHPVVRPRAVWICCYHLQLKSVLDTAWNSCVDAIRGLLLDSRRKAQTGNYAPAVSEGLLAVRPAGGQAGRHSTALAAAAGQQAEVAMLCLERLISLVSHNNRGQLSGQLAPIGSLLEKLCKLELENDCGPALKERIGRLLAAVVPVSTSGKEGGRASSSGGYVAPVGGISIRTRRVEQEEADKGGEKSAPQQQIVAELHPDPAGPTAAAYPNTLPAAAALFGTAEAVRYGHLLEQLQSAAWQEDNAAAAGGGADSAADGSGPGGSQDPTASPSGPPSLLQLTSILTGTPDGSGSGSAGGWASGGAGVEVTGPSAPLSLVLSHAVDAGRRSITLRCAVHNRTLEGIRGVEVELMLGGPVAPGHRRPLTFHLEPLPPAGSTSWESELRVSGFGWPAIQPSMRLPVKLPGGEEALMRCKPYNISPLQLLAPPAHAITAAEFYQLWQALPYRAQLSATASEPGPAGLQHAMGSMQRNASMLCVLRVSAAVHGSAQAALYGSSWDGQRIACVVSGVVDPAEAPAVVSGKRAPAALPSAATLPARLQFHFRSESAEVISHVQGHEIELLDQLTGGRVVPTAAGEEGASASGGPPSSRPAEAGSGSTGTDAFRPSTISFLRTLRTEESVAEEAPAEGGQGGVDPAAAEASRRAFEGAVLAQWQRLRAMRVA